MGPPRLTGILSVAIPLLIGPLTGCTGEEEARVIVAGTTSTYDSGLLDTLVLRFRAAHPEWEVRAIAVGSGEALALGRRGDVDVLLVHSPEAEMRFMADGHGLDRVRLMYNDFVLVGPPEDPAGAREADRAAEAFAAIARAGAPFFSRGDSSGTHVKELEIWRAARPGGAPLAGSGPGARASWYRETGQGQGTTLQIADERGAYALTDRATFRILEPWLRLQVVHEGDPSLLNLYSAIRVRRARSPDGAEAFHAWLTSGEGRAVIEGFGGRGGAEPLYRTLSIGEALPVPAGVEPAPGTLR